MNFSPLNDHEAKRLQALREYKTLATVKEREFDRLTELASLICGTPISMLSLIDDTTQWFISGYGMDLAELPKEDSFCQYTILTEELMQIEDATQDERFATNKFVIGEPFVRFYAGYPIIDPNGYTLGAFCVSGSEKKKLTDDQLQALKLLSDQATSLILEQRKKDERRNFDRLFNLSNDLICIASFDGYFKKINPAFTNVLGWDEQYILNTHFQDMVHPEDKIRTNEDLSSLINGETTTTAIHRVRHKNGSYVYIQWVTTTEQSTGNLFCIGRDVTEEKLKEEKLKISEDNFRSFFENSQGFMCTHDLAGKFLTVNTVGAKLLGYDKEQILKMSLFDIIPEKHHVILRQYLIDIQENGVSSGLMTTRHLDGSHRIWNYQNILVTTENGQHHIVGNSIDVTESQKLAKKFAKVQNMLVQTSQMARVGGWEVDMSNYQVYWSDVTKSILGVDQDYIPDVDSIRHLYKHEETLKKITEAVQIAIDERKSYDLELEITTHTGESKWLRTIGHAESDGQKGLKLYGMYQDIDEKKRAELATANSQKLLDDVLNAASEVSIIATDTDGLITVFNKGAENLLGYSADEMVGINQPGMLHLLSEMQIRSRELTEEFGSPIEGFRIFVHKAEINKSEVREWTYRTKTGELKPVTLVTTTIRDHNDEVIGYLGVATDLTARKKAEQELFNEKARLLAFVEHAPAAVAMFDRDIQYIAVSRKWMEEYRLTEQNIIGISHYDIFPNIKEHWKKHHQQALKGETISCDEELWRPPGWDIDQYLKWEVRPWYQYDGSVGGIMMFTEDITEATLVRHELKQAKIQSEQASIAKSEFLANMSHEIRTPLNGIIGFTDLVLKTNMNDTQKQYLTIVNQSANALLSIINDILDFSKIEAGKLELDIDKCDIFDITSQSADIISFPIQNKGLEMLLNIPAELPRFVWVDEIRLKQVLINLLSNAAKFTESGEIELKIEILNYHPEQSDHITCRFIVRDTGIGIREEKQAKIFDAFLQEDGSTTKKYGGTGLGLTISNKLLAMMGSHLQLSSVHGVGSTFFFDLTMTSEPGEQIIWDNAESIRRVLIVDDNQNNRLIVERMLQLMHIRSDQVTNGFEALEVLESEAVYDAILMDYHMPYMDGLETIRHIRNTFPLKTENIPIVLLNSSADDATVIKGCEELKVNYRLMKPLKINDIHLCLSRLSQKEYANEPAGTTDPIDINQDILTILIAEDNPVNMFLAKTIISKVVPAGLILEAANGLEAVEHCKRVKPDLIFMDVQMPEMNGYEATFAIRNIFSNSYVPIIALTAGNVKGERDRCIDAGMNDFVAKPFVEDSIRTIISRYAQPGAHREETPKVTQQNQEEHFDIALLKTTYMDDQEFITEFLTLTEEALEAGVIDLNKHYQNNDLSGIKNAAHKLKGASASAFMNQVTAITQELEHMTSFDKNRIEYLVSELQQESQVLMPMIASVK
ncbi:hybrid sensor histidine kinase/response regulator [Dyadobacter luteus]|jgi:PAS domain S-box-containing protein|uniref:Sensory/regulatory protein RpfC n=1 Tax=Dyadobacter luteus TaxID=2259619 RepID=A0A3D8YHD7_9BACT|nr:PAS domain S-box protein [Dyadobacter luteus]REA64218.1 hybrid sensor histidine kinase/response regulator [Dyadobacter luteus]